MDRYVADFRVDVVMCIDATNDMNLFIRKLKVVAKDFYQMLVTEMAEYDRTVDTLRVKVIVFRDYRWENEPMVETKFFELPTENEAFVEFINTIEQRGGGDPSENALEAIALALKSDWTTLPSRRRHAVMVFTDAPALAFGKRKDCPNYPAGMPKSLDELRAWWEGTDENFVSAYQPKAGRLIVFAPNEEPWREMQEWDRYWHVPVESFLGLDDVEMNEVISMLAGAIL